MSLVVQAAVLQFRCVVQKSDSFHTGTYRALSARGAEAGQIAYMALRASIRESNPSSSDGSTDLFLGNLCGLIA